MATRIQSPSKSGPLQATVVKPSRSVKSGKKQPVTVVAEASISVDNLNSDMVADLRKLAGMNQTMFARLISISTRTLANIESGHEPTESVLRRIIEIRRLFDSLSEVISPTTFGKWLTAPNPAFDGFKPIELIDRGEIDRIWSMIYFLKSGVAF
jgi:DNA-binding transcriptional regulator YiaG